MTESEAISAIQNDLKWHSKELKPAYKEALNMAIKALEEIQQYRAIGTVEEFKALKEKQIAKKPCLDQKGLLGVKMWHCPICKKEVISDWNRDLANDYCHHCGQKLYW